MKSVASELMTIPTISGELPDKYVINEDLLIASFDGCRVIDGEFKHFSGFYCAHPKCAKAAKYFEDASKFKQYAKLAASQPFVMRRLVIDVTCMDYQDYLDSLK